MQRARKGMSDAFLSMDMYGHPVSVNFRGDQNYSTMYGSCMSILVAVLIVTFTALKTKQFGLREYPQFSKNSAYKSLDDYGEMYANDIRFEFAFAMYNIRSRTYAVPDPRMIVPNTRRVDMTTGENITFVRNRIGHHKCDQQEHFLGIKPEIWQTSQLDQFMCIEKEDLFFKGSLISKVNSYFVFDMMPCVGPDCATEQELQDYLDANAVVGITNNNFLDLYRYDDPIQSSLDYTILDQLQVNGTVYRTIKLGLNEGHLNDDQYELFESDQIDHLFVSTENVEFSTLRSFNPGALFTARFVIHDMILIHNRYVYNILQFIGDVGGCGQAVAVIGSFFVSLISAKLFYAALIRDTFRVRLDAGGANIQSLYSAKYRNSADAKPKIKSWQLTNLNQIKTGTFPSEKSSSSDPELPVQPSVGQAADVENQNMQTNPDQVSQTQNEIDLVQQTVSNLLSPPKSKPLSQLEPDSKNLSLPVQAHETLSPFESKEQVQEPGPQSKNPQHDQIMAKLKSIRFAIDRSKRRSTVARKSFSREEKDIEHAMFLQKPHVLTAKDVNGTLFQHIKRYQNFIYTKWEVLSDALRICRKRSRKQQKLMILFQQGITRVQQYLDVREIVKTIHKVKLMHDLFFRKQGRQLVRLQRRNLLEFGGSDSQINSSSNSDPAKQTKYLSSLVGWTAKTPVEKKLVLGVLHRSGHKNFEEADDAKVQKLLQRKKSLLGQRHKSILSVKSSKRLSMLQDQASQIPFAEKIHEDVEESSESISDLDVHYQRSQRLNKKRFVSDEESEIQDLQNQENVVAISKLTRMMTQQRRFTNDTYQADKVRKLLGEMQKAISGYDEIGTPLAKGSLRMSSENEGCKFPRKQSVAKDTPKSAEEGSSYNVNEGPSSQ